MEPALDQENKMIDYLSLSLRVGEGVRRLVGFLEAGPCFVFPSAYGSFPGLV